MSLKSIKGREGNGRGGSRGKKEQEKEGDQEEEVRNRRVGRREDTEQRTPNTARHRRHYHVVI